MRILLVSSSGGHLAQLLATKTWWERHERVWVTFNTDDARARLKDETVIFGHSPTTRNINNLARNTALARRVLAHYRPDLVFSNGAGIAVPFFYLARAFGARTAYLEVIDRIDSASLTGRLVYPVTDDFLVQWPEQRALYPAATVVGLVY
jgi:UDP-N-acetylglucosamine:LPS N-acetylglucosamine transferase